jgi:hypothetical protein
MVFKHLKDIFFTKIYKKKLINFQLKVKKINIALLQYVMINKQFNNI